ncbi:hypothetical protein G7K_4095-t1 [Saitoella complicata NRRL Y-17804]|uniref:Trafficking protein particle complex subunit 11 domain-containing protein n=1 Tax=Saitoella complicata (strain BCRC 22490 / CBS 7301 / JCM 7358 / NBRC 10748 / NRRL Y-17804) TaxID=698492 RepID=A0A0E9NKN0_SAICN|nr:hypothetical protein G7K_4095-t1 [Saitoella complicata NRRL Y-17804]
MRITLLTQPTDYDPSNLWPSISPQLRRRLPLRNLHWKSANRPLRSIQTLDVALLPYTSSSIDEQQHQIAGVGLLDKPYLNIFLVQCEDNDVYRSTVRTSIRNWLNGVLAKKNQEWLIVHVVPNAIESLATTKSPPSSGALLRIKGSVYDKIRADFNSSKKDRCIQLRLSQSSADLASSGTDEIEMWQDLTSKLKEGILIAFDQRVTQYEDDVRKLDAQRTMPGWNYNTFFGVKEGLGRSFEEMGLSEDGLVVYDELEASFFLSLSDKEGEMWGTSGGLPGVGDDSASVLDTERKKYRDLILQNTITTFDFRCYLFARQFALLAKLGNPIAQLVRAKDFIVGVGRMLSWAGMSDAFVESWIWCAASEILEACVPISGAGMDGGRIRALAAAKGDLVVLKRTQIDKMGLRAGLLPDEWPWAGMGMVELDEKEGEEDKFGEVSCEELLEVIEDRDKFFELYRRTNREALDELQRGGRTNTADKILADTACTEFYLKNYAEAAKLLERLPGVYEKEGWSKISGMLLRRYATCLQNIGKDEQYLSVCLKLLTYKLEREDAVHYLEEVKRLSKSVEETVVAHLEGIFEFTIPTRARGREGEDGFEVAVPVRNRLVDGVEIDSVELVMVDVETRKTSITFTCGRQDLVNGKNEIVLSMNVSQGGEYEVTRLAVAIGKVVLSTTMTEGNGKKLRLYPSPHTLSARLVAPRHVHLDALNRCVIELRTGRNDVQSGKISVLCRTPGVRLLMKDASVVHEDSTAEVETDLSQPNVISFAAVSAQQTIRFSFPYAYDVDLSCVTATISVSYTTPTGTFTSTSTSTMEARLPLAVNVHDLFKAHTLFSKFSISCANGPLRILEAGLEESEEFAVGSAPRKGTERGDVVFGSHSASYMFRISRRGDAKKVSEAPAPLSLKVRFRTLEDELRWARRQYLRKLLGEAGLEKVAHLFVNALNEVRVDDGKATEWALMEEVKGEEWQWAEWDLLMNEVGKEERERLKDALETFTKARIEVTDEMKEGLPNLERTIEIPVDVPEPRVVFTALLELRNEVDLEIGAPVSAELTITRDSSWGSDEEFARAAIDCLYEVQVDSEAWLLSGKRRAGFLLDGKKTETFSLLLVPLKSGHLMLPTVDVMVVKPEGTSCQVDFTPAEVRVLPTVRSTSVVLGGDVQIPVGA